MNDGRAYVYLLRCADSSLYCGWTTDPQRRESEHNAGTGSRYTRARLPARMVAVWSAADRGAALRAEAQIKRLSRAEKRALVEGRPMEGLHRLTP